MTRGEVLIASARALAHDDDFGSTLSTMLGAAAQAFGIGSAAIVAPVGDGARLEIIASFGLDERAARQGKASRCQLAAQSGNRSGVMPGARISTGGAAPSTSRMTRTAGPATSLGPGRSSVTMTFVPSGDHAGWNQP